MIAIINTAIYWGDYIVTDLFSVSEVSEPPDQEVFSYTFDNIPNGTYRELATVNTENTFSITITRDTAKKENIELFQQLFKEQKVYRMRMVNLTTGEVLVEYKTAKLANTKFVMGGVSDGKGVDTTMTWAVTNARG